MKMNIRYKVDRALGEDEYSGLVTIDDGDGGSEPFEGLSWAELIDLVMGMAEDCVPDEIYVRVGSGRKQQLSDDAVVRLTTGEWRVTEPLIGG